MGYLCIPVDGPLRTEIQQCTGEVFIAFGITNKQINHSLIHTLRQHHLKKETHEKQSKYKSQEAW